MNHWAFVAAAYLVAIGGAAALACASLVAMRRAERDAHRADPGRR